MNKADLSANNGKKNNALLKFFLIPLTVASIANILLDFLSPYKFELLIVCVMAILFKLVVQKQSNIKSIIITLLIAALLISPILTRAVNGLGKRNNEEEIFVQRIERMLHCRYHVYSPRRVIPTSIYSFLKRKMNRLFVPPVLDNAHIFNEVNIEYAHIQNWGVFHYFLKGTTYGSDHIPYYFITCAETPYVDDNMCAYHIENGDTILSENIEKYGPENKWDIFLCVGKVPINYTDFSFGYVVHAHNAMTKNREFFLLDLRNIIHRPQRFVASVYCDTAWRKAGIWRVKMKQYTMLDWLRCNSRIQLIDIPSNEAIEEVVPREDIAASANFIRGKINVDTLQLRSLRWTILSRDNHEENMYVITYYTD